jgi:hypothetical protein
LSNYIVFATFITDCSEMVSLTTLPSYTSCRLPSYCTGAQCCTEIGILGRSWVTHILVDTCRYRVSIGIEKQTVNITLFEFVQGSWATVTLGNVLRLGYERIVAYLFLYCNLCIYCLYKVVYIIFFTSNGFAILFVKLTIFCKHVIAV